MTTLEHYLALTKAFFQHIGQDAGASLAHYFSLAEPILDQYGYFAVFATVLVEGFGIPAPGQTMLMAGSVLAARGGMSLTWVLTLAFAAAALGNSLGYLLGRWGGHRILIKIGVSDARLLRVEALFNRYGSGVVMTGRFFDGLRQLNGIMAGSLEMPWWRFTLFNVLGAALWVGLWGLGVYSFEHDIGAVFAIFHRAEPYIIALTLLSLVGLLVYLRRGRRR